MPKDANQRLFGWYIGYKFHLISTDSGIYRDMIVSSASEHDINFLKILDKEDEHLRGHELLGDKGYIGQAVQLELFEELEIALNVPYKRNQIDFKPYPYSKKIKRKTIEVIFSQYCDEFNMKRIYAKRFDGIYARMIAKVFAKTFKQYINSLNGRPINRTKHSLVA